MSKKILTSILLLSLLITTLALGACGSDGQSESSAPAEVKDVVYKVTVKDVLGTPCSSGVIVRFLKNGESVTMQPCNEQGEVSKSLPAGDYTVELGFTDGEENYHYEVKNALSADVAETEVILSKKITAEPDELFASNGKYDAYAVTVGCTYVKLDKENRSYFLFAPTEAGMYEFSVSGNDKTAIGHYGTPHYVQENSIVEVKDNKFSVSVNASMIGSGESGTSVFVIGVDLLEGGENNCILTIVRTGDPERTIEDEPWTIYEKTVELSQYTLPENGEIKEFDLTASSDTYSIVYNENDGFYHLDSEDGPLVLVRLAEDCEYIACFETILDRSGVMKYFFNENGEFEKKESYSECLLEYIEFVDEAEGVYPLTEDLKYIIQQRGEYVGWWNPESASYLFKDGNGNKLTDINNDIAWLLMCCYVEDGE